MSFKSAFIFIQTPYNSDGKVNGGDQNPIRVKKLGQQGHYDFINLKMMIDVRN